MLLVTVVAGVLMGMGMLLTAMAHLAEAAVAETAEAVAHQVEAVAHQVEVVTHLVEAVAEIVERQVARGLCLSQKAPTNHKSLLIHRILSLVSTATAAFWWLVFLCVSCPFWFPGAEPRLRIDVSTMQLMARVDTTPLVVAQLRSSLLSKWVGPMLKSMKYCEHVAVLDTPPHKFKSWIPLNFLYLCILFVLHSGTLWDQVSKSFVSIVSIAATCCAYCGKSSICLRL